MELKVPCSEDQIEALVDYSLNLGPLRTPPDEKHWILAQARKKIPNCKIKSACLIIEDGEWLVEI